MVIGFGDKCCGCTACENICPKKAITMIENKKGFLEPNIRKSKCVECGLCEMVCPLTKKSKVVNNQIFLAAKCKDIGKRTKSQSGGAFFLIAEEILKRNGAVYGVVLDKKLNVVYCRATDKRTVEKMRGSKYVQSTLGNTFAKIQEDLRQGKWVLFSGTPCYVSGLKSFLKQRNLPAETLITVDLICHGVPSEKVYRDYIKIVEERHKKKVTDFNFRDKRFGWHGHNITIIIGRKKYKNNDFVNFFYSHLGLRDSCYSCNYANLNRVGDITIGDCWGIEKFAPELDDNKGVSLVILNTEIGKKMWALIDTGFESIEVTKGQIMQPNLQHPTECPLDVCDFWKDYEAYGCEYALIRYCGCNPKLECRINERIWVTRLLIRTLKCFIGCLRRLLRRMKKKHG